MYYRVDILKLNYEDCEDILQSYAKNMAFTDNTYNKGRGSFGDLCPILDKILNIQRIARYQYPIDKYWDDEAGFDIQDDSSWDFDKFSKDNDISIRQAKKILSLFVNKKSQRDSSEIQLNELLKILYPNKNYVIYSGSNNYNGVLVLYNADVLNEHDANIIFDSVYYNIGMLTITDSSGEEFICDGQYMTNDEYINTVDALLSDRTEKPMSLIKSKSGVFGLNIKNTCICVEDDWLSASGEPLCLLNSDIAVDYFGYTGEILPNINHL